MGAKVEGEWRLHDLAKWAVQLRSLLEFVLTNSARERWGICLKEGGHTGSPVDRAAATLLSES